MEKAQKGLLITLLFILLAVGSAAVFSMTQKYTANNISYSYNTTNNSLVGFSASITEESVRPFSPAVVELSVKNKNKNLKTYSGLFPPFDIVEAHKEKSNSSINLWHEGYKEAGLIDGDVVNFGGKERYWTENISRKYKITYWDRLGKGTIDQGKYVINDSLSYSGPKGSGKSEKLNYTVTFELDQ